VRDDLLPRYFGTSGKRRQSETSAITMRFGWLARTAFVFFSQLSLFAKTSFVRGPSSASNYFGFAVLNFCVLTCHFPSSSFIFEKAKVGVLRPLTVT
jgi:hypothetical protein